MFSHSSVTLFLDSYKMRIRKLHLIIMYNLCIRILLLGCSLYHTFLLYECLKQSFSCLIKEKRAMNTRLKTNNARVIKYVPGTQHSRTSSFKTSTICKYQKYSREFIIPRFRFLTFMLPFVVFFFIYLIDGSNFSKLTITKASC